MLDMESAAKQAVKNAGSEGDDRGRQSTSRSIRRISSNPTVGTWGYWYDRLS